MPRPKRTVASSTEPALDTVKRYRTVESITIGAEANKIRIKPGYDIHVRAPENDSAPQWLMKVNTIHQHEGQNWLVGYWYYTAEQAHLLKNLAPGTKKMLKYMAGCELLLSSHEDKISATAIEYQANVFKLLDGAGTQIQFNTNDWYYRWRLIQNNDGFWALEDVIISCVCGKPYNPENDSQCWCKHCEAWLHINCTRSHRNEGQSMQKSLGEDDDKERDEEEVISMGHLEELEGDTSYRGMAGKECSEVPRWAITGSKPFLQKCREEYEENGEIEDGDRVADLLDMLKKRDLRARRCPKCLSDM